MGMPAKYWPSSVASLRYRRSTTILNDSTKISGSFKVPGQQLGKGRGMAREDSTYYSSSSADFRSIDKHWLLPYHFPTLSLVHPLNLLSVPLSAINPLIWLSLVYRSPISDSVTGAYSDVGCLQTVALANVLKTTTILLQFVSTQNV